MFAALAVGLVVPEALELPAAVVVVPCGAACVEAGVVVVVVV